MGPESILLSVDGDGQEGTYAFVCPVCSGDVEKQADRKIVALLVSAGVSMAEGAVMAPAPPKVDVGLPAFTLDDVIQFHYLLEDDFFLERLLSE